MDVQSVAPATGTTAPETQASAGAVSGTTAPATPQAPSGTSAQPAQGSATLSAAIAKLYNVGGGSASAPATLDVSYKVVHPLNIIVTVFTNPHTGEEVAQFPPEVLIGLAEFFDQIDGVTLDQKA